MPGRRGVKRGRNKEDPKPKLAFVPTKRRTPINLFDLPKNRRPDWVEENDKGLLWVNHNDEELNVSASPVKRFKEPNIEPNFFGLPVDMPPKPSAVGRTLYFSNALEKEEEARGLTRVFAANAEVGDRLIYTELGGPTSYVTVTSTTAGYCRVKNDITEREFNLPYREDGFEYRLYKNKAARGGTRRRRNRITRKLKRAPRGKTRNVR